jgi:hypothetical protein
MMITQTIFAVVLAFCLSAASLAAEAQPTRKIPRVGVLVICSPIR